MKTNNDIEMKEHKVSPVLLNHKAGALVSLIETVTMLQICLCSTFWTQHKAYAASRFSIIRTFEKTSMLKAAIEQYEGRYPLFISNHLHTCLDKEPSDDTHQAVAFPI